MLICDVDCNILACNAQYPGSVHDSAIWRVSDIKNFLRNEYENGDITSHLLGDSGYGLEPWLFTPFNRVVAGTPEARFNELHKLTRNVIERTNGILKGRFRCLLRHRVLHYHPAKAAYIVYAAAVLHNIATWANLDIDEDDIVLNDNDENIGHRNILEEDNMLHLGRAARAMYIRQNIL
ncbi:putative nuclease HARBI1 [Anoplophora glabripennis]|uniref:putative nuclease HARBI1 n=1 Tax=Anoplophora glabripennis TaxID=217634 RepID=UPI000874C501|nr:putative nuclease HARBI1 [Anoplophora glabripennis]